MAAVDLPAAIPPPPKDTTVNYSTAKILGAARGAAIRAGGDDPRGRMNEAKAAAVNAIVRRKWMGRGLLPTSTARLNALAPTTTREHADRRGRAWATNDRRVAVATAVWSATLMTDAMPRSAAVRGRPRHNPTSALLSAELNGAAAYAKRARVCWVRPLPPALASLASLDAGAAAYRDLIANIGDGGFADEAANVVRWRKNEARMAAYEYPSPNARQLDPLAVATAVWSAAKAVDATARRRGI